eukprot:CAMPEP_0194411940 /NCGR_PEP_ID=MMETSP0176-20130528/10289_1 /TAXON_ID=216777 /ORGANISM="Proboscia alata, Strain PI-D3" /LENGTH=43 /DNA_ID= /DNA_START= /DNA_END= /DNA_ORIENTATION=
MTLFSFVMFRMVGDLLWVGVAEEHHLAYVSRIVSVRVHLADVK